MTELVEFLRIAEWPLSTLVLVSVFSFMVWRQEKQLEAQRKEFMWLYKACLDDDDDEHNAKD